MFLSLPKRKQFLLKGILRKLIFKSSELGILRSLYLGVAICVRVSGLCHVNS